MRATLTTTHTADRTAGISFQANVTLLYENGHIYVLLLRDNPTETDGIISSNKAERDSSLSVKVIMTKEEVEGLKGEEKDGMEDWGDKQNRGAGCLCPVSSYS